MLGTPQPTTQSPLRNAFFTVTPLSKALAMLLFIALPLGAFYFGLSIGQAPLGPKEYKPQTQPQSNTPRPAKTTELPETTYINNDYQFITSFRISDTCATANASKSLCLPIRFADPAVVSSTTPILSLQDGDIKLEVFTTRQKVSAMTSLGSTQIGGKIATAYHHDIGPIYEQRNSEDEFWLLEIPTTANRWLYIYIPSTDENAPVLNELPKTLAYFEAVLADRKQLQGSRLLQTLRFLDETSVKADLPNWQQQSFSTYQLSVPSEATVEKSEYTMKISFPQTGSTPSEMNLNLFEFSEITKDGSTNPVTGLEKMYTLTGTKPRITELTPTLKFYTYIKTEPARVIFAGSSTITTTQYFVIDEENKKIIEVKDGVEASYWPTFMAITKSIR
jgi:hypothetical protein